MNDLILRTKVEILEQNLAQVKKFVDDVKDRQRDLTRISFTLGQEISPRINDFLLAIDQPKSQLSRSDVVLGKRLLEQFEETKETKNFELRRSDILEGKQIAQQLGEIQKNIETTQGMLKQVMEIVTDMQARSVEINKDLDRTLKKELGQLAIKSSNKLAEIHHIRELAQVAESNNDMSATDELLQKSWKLYGDEIYHDSQRIFEEYVDVLGGLTLRDSFVDLGICQIADELIAGWVEGALIEWGSLTIPAHRESLEMSVARIIRLGFPEWTIWALPLTARGIGDVVIEDENNKVLRRYIKTHATDKLPMAHLHSFFADAFATYAMGPAYVYAAILLRFDPFSAYIEKDEEPAGAKRAYVMFAMLEKMQEVALKVSLSADPYSPIITKVKAEWEAALLQVGASSSLQDADKEQLKQWVTYFFTYLKHNIYEEDVLYSQALWLRIEDLSKELLQDDIQAIDLDKCDLRVVLNAAWACRVNHDGTTDAIAKAARELCERIYNRNSKLKREHERNRGAKLGSLSSRKE